MNREFLFYIDVVQGCNLKCPTCPMGNSRHVYNSTGLMAPETLNNILTKAANECHITAVALYNWAEPLLHPRLCDLVSVVKSHGVPCHLSSNLNLTVDFESILRAGTDFFIISTSGFYQPVYGVTHRGGDAERLKRNMKNLSVANRKLNGKTAIQVSFHRYLGNSEDEMLMRAYASELGFSFFPMWAYLMPVERVLALVEEDTGRAGTAEDFEILNRFALPLKDALDSCSRYRERPCTLRDDQMVLNSAGEAQLCCAVFDADRHSIGNYLETSLEELQSRKALSGTCVKCMDYGIHVLYVYGSPELDQIAIDNLRMLNLDSGCNR